MDGGMSCDQYGEGCVWRPADHERDDHHHHHTGHLPLWLLGSGQTTMGYLDKNTEPWASCTVLCSLTDSLSIVLDYEHIVFYFYCY